MSDQIILDLSTQEIVECYNQLSKIEVKKFKDRKTAEGRLHGLAHIDTAKFLKAMKAVKVRPEIIAKYETELAAAAKEKEKAQARAEAQAAEKTNAAAKAAEEKTSRKGAKVKVVASDGEPADPEFAAAAKTLLDAQRKKKEKEQEDAGTEAPQRKRGHRNAPTELEPGSRAAAVLWFAQSQMRQHKTKNEDEVTTSTELARAAVTSTKEVVKQIDILVQLGYVTIEDDSTDPNDPFYYVTLTDKGSSFDIQAKQPGYPKGKEAREPRQPRVPRLPGAAPGPRSDKAGKKIYKLAKGNPRREGTHGWKSYNLVHDGMSFEEYIEAGGRATDLQWDLDHQFVELR
jgi:hypothetical protein